MTAQSFLDGRVTLHAGDCLAVLEAFDESSVDSVCCDPPYHLTSIIKRFAKTGGADRKPPKKHHQFRRLSKGFMGKDWDGGDVAFRSETWAAVLRVLKPGGYLIAFSGVRTYHRMVTAIEDAGFEIRDQIGWAFGSGFPKSKDLGAGFGTALKPAWEPICVARKPLIGTNAENIAEFGVAGINIDACRIHADDALGGDYTVKRLKPGATLEATGGNWRPEEGGVEYHGTMKPGRWPANLIHDGSDEVLAAFPETGQQQDIDPSAPSPKTGNVYGAMKREGEASANRRYADEGATNFAALPGARRNDSGSAARFFYTAKADADDRLGSKHPTVKPLDLMQYLVRLVTPPGGLVLDPFAGTGTTGEAAWREGMRAVLIEREPEYQADIARRMDLAQNPTRRAAVAKSKNNLQGAEGTPLFGDVA